MKSEFPRKSHFVLWQRKYEREVLRYEAGAPNTRRHHGQDQLALDAATESVLSLLEKPFCLEGGFLSPAHGSLPPGLLLHVSHGPVPILWSLHSVCTLLQYAIKGLSIANGLQRSPATEVIRAGSCHYRAWPRMPLVTKTRLDLHASPFNYGKAVPRADIIKTIWSREYARVNDGVLELRWNLKLSPEFRYSLLIYKQRL